MKVPPLFVPVFRMDLLVDFGEILNQISIDFCSIYLLFSIDMPY